MPVLVEAISVITRIDAIHSKYVGGWETFLSDVRNQTLCHDDELVRVGFMTPVDVGQFVNHLEANGLTFIENGNAVDFVVVDQREGPTAPCSWIEFYYLTIFSIDGTIAVCRLRGNATHRVALPGNWSYERSLSCQHQFVPNEAMETNMRFLRREAGLDVYLDLTTGKEAFVGRTPS